DDPGTTFHDILLPSPAPYLLTEQRDERLLGHFPPYLVRRSSGDLAELLRELPRRVVAGFGRHVFDRTPWVLQERIRAQQPRGHYECSGRIDPGRLEISIQRAEVHPRGRGEIVSVFEPRR